MVNVKKQKQKEWYNLSTKIFNSPKGKIFMRILGPVAESNALAQVDPPSEITIVASFALDKNSPSFVPQNLGAQQGDVAIWIYAIDNTTTPVTTLSVNGGPLRPDSLFVSESADYDDLLFFARRTSPNSVGAVMCAIEIGDPTDSLAIRVESGDYSDPVVAGVILRGQRIEGEGDDTDPRCFSPQVSTYLTGKTTGTTWSPATPYPRLRGRTITNPPSPQQIAAGYNGPRIVLNFVAVSTSAGSSLQPPAGWTKLIDHVTPSPASASAAIAYRFVALDGVTSWATEEWAANQISDSISYLFAVELGSFKRWTRDD